MKYCMRCGHQLNDKYTYCTHCGEPQPVLDDHRHEGEKEAPEAASSQTEQQNQGAASGVRTPASLFSGARRGRIPRVPHAPVEPSEVEKTLIRSDLAEVLRRNAEEKAATPESEPSDEEPAQGSGGEEARESDKEAATDEASIPADEAHASNDSSKSAPSSQAGAVGTEADAQGSAAGKDSTALPPASNEPLDASPSDEARPSEEASSEDSADSDEAVAAAEDSSPAAEDSVPVEVEALASDEAPAEGPSEDSSTQAGEAVAEASESEPEAPEVELPEEHAAQAPQDQETPLIDVQDDPFAENAEEPVDVSEPDSGWDPFVNLDIPPVQSAPAPQVVVVQVPQAPAQTPPAGDVSWRQPGVIAAIVSSCLAVASLVVLLLYIFWWTPLEQARAVAEAGQATISVHVGVSAPGLDTDTGSKIPVTITGIETTGEQVEATAFVSSNGYGIALKAGTYLVSVAASPFAADGVLYYVPSTVYTLDISEPAPAIVTQSNGTPVADLASSIYLELVPMNFLNVTQDTIELAYQYALLGGASSPQKALTLKDAAETAWETAQETATNQARARAESEARLEEDRKAQEAIANAGSREAQDEALAAAEEAARARAEALAAEQARDREALLNQAQGGDAADGTASDRVDLESIDPNEPFTYLQLSSFEVGVPTYWRGRATWALDEEADSVTFHPVGATDIPLCVLTGSAPADDSDSVSPQRQATDPTKGLGETASYDDGSVTLWTIPSPVILGTEKGDFDPSRTIANRLLELLSGGTWTYASAERAASEGDLPDVSEWLVGVLDVRPL